MDNIELTDAEKDALSKLELLPGDITSSDYNKINKQNERIMYENAMFDDEYNFLYLFERP